MTCAREQPPREQIERDYPHQILISAGSTRGKVLKKVISFHKDIRAPIKSRSVFQDGQWYTVYRFADETHADVFLATFGGLKKS